MPYRNRNSVQITFLTDPNTTNPPLASPCLAESTEAQWYPRGAISPTPIPTSTPTVLPSPTPEPEIPVILVHGILSDSSMWSEYLGDSGYLKSIGRKGYAVNLRQGPGPSDTLDVSARKLSNFIQSVKQQTGASQVDIVAHSRGGLISRLYVSKYMKDRDVRKLIMLGTPNLGSFTAVLARLATIDIRTRFLTYIYIHGL